MKHTELKLSALEESITSLMKLMYDPSFDHILGRDQVRDALSDGQIYSKSWLLDVMHQLDTTVGPILVVGGWWGLLARAIATTTDRQVVSLDLDEDATKVASRMLRGLGKAHCGDAFDYDYVGFGLVINTSTEHFTSPMVDWLNLIPRGTAVIAQNNDDDSIPDHVNCHPDVDSFATSCQFSNILFKDSLEFPQYTRHMVFGVV